MRRPSDTRWEPPVWLIRGSTGTNVEAAICRVIPFLQSLVQLPLAGPCGPASTLVMTSRRACVLARGPYESDDFAWRPCAYPVGQNADEGLLDAQPNGALLREQLRVLWEWRGGRVALLKRLVITLVVATISFIATAALLPRMTIDRPIDAVLAVIFMALFNAIVRPVVLALAAPVSLILVGILVLVLQVVAFLVVAQFAPGVHVDTFLTALIGSFIYAIINTILTAILGIDSGGSYYGLLVQRLHGQAVARGTRTSRAW